MTSVRRHAARGLVALTGWFTEDFTLAELKTLRLSLIHI